MARALRNQPSPRRYMAMEPSPEFASRHGAKGERHFKHSMSTSFYILSHKEADSVSAISQC
ncbi:BnaCnng39250D [Brassica napus]|uniref:BnaCnng39250D protein n=1 Tax=Brassica napus TaxID=3708 RepID=A0A078J6N2_BRANA|nr:BnaCnng39250D [Brassica napus]